MSERFSEIESSHTSEEMAERFLENLDMTHEMERIISTIIESGPEMDPQHLAVLQDYFDYLISMLRRPIDDPIAFVKETKEAAGIDEGEVSRILWAHKLPELLRQAVEKIIAGRHEGLSDRAIYRRLARIYHPDQTVLEQDEAEEIFKIIGQRLYDENDGFSRLF